MTTGPGSRTLEMMAEMLSARDRETVITCALAAAVSVLVALVITVSEEDDATRDPDLLAYLLAPALGLALAGRRRRPLGVLLASIGLLMIYYIIGYPGFSPAVPLAAATFFAAYQGRALAAGVVLGLFLAFGAAWQMLGEDTAARNVVANSLLTDGALLAAVGLLGVAVRNRLALNDEVAARLRRAKLDQVREAETRVQHERMHTARELHDILAHTVAALNVQAGVATDVLDDDPDRAREALEAIRAQSRQAIAELHATVTVLRGTENRQLDRAPPPGVGDMDGLIRTTAAAGVETRVGVDGQARPLPAAIDLTAYRIIQESLTNVVRHARAGNAEVLLSYEPDALLVRIEDDGSGSGKANGGGEYGLLGMRERVTALGGEFEAGSGPDGGFRVEARLPLPGSDP